LEYFQGIQKPLGGGQEMKSTAITTQQLADLAELSPSFFTLHRNDLHLPEAFDVPSTSRLGGRPAKAYSIEQIAEFILDRTSFLTDAECRLRVALSNPKSRKGGRDMFRLLVDENGDHIVTPDDFSKLSPELRVKVLAAIAQEHAETRARRCARRQTRSNPATDQEIQP